MTSFDLGWGSRVCSTIGAAIAFGACVAATACGSSFGTGGADDGGASANDGGATGDGASVDEGGGDGAPTSEPCAKVGDVRFCKPPSGGDGAQTCVPRPDKTDVWGTCVPSACDPSAKPLTFANESCFPAGRFSMGGLDGTNGWPSEGDTLPAHDVVMRRRFYVDQYETTVEEFMKWWNANPRVMPSDGDLVFVSGNGDAIRWKGAWTTSAVAAPGTDLGFGCVATLGKGTASINCVTFETALAYCMSHGKRLPSEAEWEYIASGNGKRNPWPWGTTPDPDDTCTWTIDKPCYQQHTTLWPFARGVAHPGDTTYGAVNNLAGNVSEWTLDFYPAAGCTQSSSCWPAGKSDPLAIGDNGFGHVVRGGSYQSDVDQVRPQARAFQRATNATSAPVGVRCVRDEL
jgi:formylglycine-generating enzyme required for sulfatase activity